LHNRRVYNHFDYLERTIESTPGSAEGSTDGSRGAGGNPVRAANNNGVGTYIMAGEAEVVGGESVF